jgi:hypothetical protein
MKTRATFRVAALVGVTALVASLAGTAQAKHFSAWGPPQKLDEIAGNSAELKLGQLAALDQRIAVRYHMTGMTLQETAGYLRHHLALAGRSDTLFSEDATALLHQTSRGSPRAVNNLAIQSLLAAFATNKSIVDESSARTAVTEVTTE